MSVENKNKVTTFFNSQFGQIRTVMIDDEPWFVGKDIATALRYINSNVAIRKHVDEEDKKLGARNTTPAFTDSLGREQFPTLINESGMYALILKAKTSTAKKFKHWVTSTVLPSIRKTGVYKLETTAPVENVSVLDIFKTQIKLFDEQQAAIKKLEAASQKNEEDIKELREKVVAKPAAGAKTLAQAASYFNFYSKNGLPHAKAMRIIASAAGIRTKAVYPFDDDYSQAIDTCIDGQVIPVLYIKPAGLAKIRTWLAINMKSLKVVERYKINSKKNSVGDIKNQYHFINGMKLYIFDADGKAA